ncbi:putative ribonuclease H-like domain-containing protein [Tanacetum coccineum]
MSVIYSLWEVIENGNAPPITKVVEGVETTIAPINADEMAQRSVKRFGWDCVLKDSENLLKLSNWSSLVKVSHKRCESEILRSLSLDAVICTFFAIRSYTPQLGHEDLQQIHPDDLKRCTDRWQMVMLTMRARRFLKNTGRKLIVNGNETIGFDKSKAAQHSANCQLCFPLSTKSYVLLCSKSILCLTLMMMKTVAKFDEDAMEEIDISFGKWLFETCAILVKMDLVNFAVGATKWIYTWSLALMANKLRGVFLPQGLLTDLKDLENHLIYLGLRMEILLNHKLVLPQNIYTLNNLEGQSRRRSQGYAIITSGCSWKRESQEKGNIKDILHRLLRKSSYVEELVQPPFCFCKSVIRRHNIKNDVYILDLKNIFPSRGVTWFGCKGNKDEVSLDTEIGACHLMEYQHKRETAQASFKRLKERTSEEAYMLDSSSNSKGLESITGHKKGSRLSSCKTFLRIRDSKRKRKENYADSKEQGITCDDAEDLDDQQFIVHTTQPMPPEERTAAKEVKLSSEDQALHDELVSLMHQESLAKAHNDDQRIAFEEEKRRISIAKGKEHVDSTFTLSTANTPPQSTGNTPTDSDDDTPTDGVFSTNSFDAEEGGVADYNNMDPTIDVPSTPTLRIHKIHPQSQIIGKSTAGVQTRRKLQDSTSNQHQALLSFIYKQNRTNHKDQQTCLFACFLSQEEPKKVSQALADESWVEAMQEELLQFKLQEVWVLCDLPEGKRVIGTKWVFRNKRDERGTIIKNKARLVAQGYRQEEGVDYDEVFAPVARIEAIRLFLAFASFMGFIVYQMDVKSAFLYGNITEEVYVKQPPGFEDPAHPNKVYRVVKALYGLHQAPRAWYERLSTFLLKHGYRRGAIDKTLFIKKDRRDIMLVQVYVDDIIFGSTKSSMVKDFEDLMQKEFKMSSMGELTFFLGLQVKQTSAGIFLSQDKYVKDILNKFDFRTIKPASTPIEAHKSLGKDEEGEDVDVHLYRSMIGCLMYLTASRPDIMFAVCLCARFQVTPKVSHLHAVKRIFRYLKHQPKLGLWYPKDSPFHLEAFSDSDYAGDNHDRRSTSGGCQYLGRRLVSWQCKKQTIVAISSTEAEYVAAASCCAQVLWMQNQLLDYGFNFMNTEIHIDNKSTICIVKNPVFHSKTKLLSH